MAHEMADRNRELKRRETEILNTLLDSATLKKIVGVCIKCRKIGEPMNTLIPFRSLDDIRHFDDFFSQLMGGSQCQTPQTNLMSIPLDVIEDEGTVTIKAAVPGVDPEELELSIENNVLTIKGEHKTEEVSENAKVFRRENTYGAFSRSIRLSSQLNQEAVNASFKNGFVTITIPKFEEEKPKSLRIPISTEN